MPQSPDLSIYGWFDDAGDTPAHDPGVGTPCPICREAVTLDDCCSVSTLPIEPGDEQRCYFFRAHKTCWNAANDDVKGEIETAPFASSRRRALRAVGTDKATTEE